MKKDISLQHHLFFRNQYLRKLKQPCSVVQPLVVLCGGWSLETFKQVANKLSKNKSSPLPFYFPNSQSMDSLSKNKNVLKSIFKVFDSRGLGRIDACQLYSILLMLSKGSYQTFLKTMVDIFGFQRLGQINRNQFFFFIDSFYRAIRQNGPILQPNVRLNYEDINSFLDNLYDNGRTDIQKNQIYEVMMKATELNDFMKYVQKRCVISAEMYRNSTIERIKFESQVRKCLADIIQQVQLQLKPDNRILQQ